MFKDNRIGETAAGFLADALKVNGTLKSLQLAVKFLILAFCKVN